MFSALMVRSFKRAFIESSERITLLRVVFFGFKETSDYPRFWVGEPVANVQGFDLKAIGVISLNMILLLSGRLSKGGFLC